jgi:hypothetical protein
MPEFRLRLSSQAIALAAGAAGIVSYLALDRFCDGYLETMAMVRTIDPSIADKACGRAEGPMVIALGLALSALLASTRLRKLGMGDEALRERIAGILLFGGVLVSLSIFALSLIVLYFSRTLGSDASFLP